MNTTPQTGDIICFNTLPGMTFVVKQWHDCKSGELYDVDNLTSTPLYYEGDGYIKRMILIPATGILKDISDRFKARF